MAPSALPAPTLRVERSCWESGDEVVCAIDEVGRGAWAGPVTVGAVVVPPSRRITRVRDSKVLSRGQRERLFEPITEWAEGHAVGHATPGECDALGMTAALRLAASRALAALDARGFIPDRILLDGRHDYLGMGNRVRTLVRGDATSLGVAAASVLAKVTRDRLMHEEAGNYPAFGFETNVGYPSAAHRTALAAYGPTAIHRRSWAFMGELPWFHEGPAQGHLF